MSRRARSSLTTGARTSTAANRNDRILITGAAGLAGSWLRRYLAREGYDRVFSMDVAPHRGEDHWHEGSVRDPEAIDRVLRAVEPDCIFHLAGLLGNRDAAELRGVNVDGTRNLFEALTALKMFTVKVLVTSSSAVYGDKGKISVTEDLALDGVSNYARSKREQEECALSYLSRGLTVMLTRAFNNIAPGERESMLVSRIAVQIARIERGEQSLLEIGPLSSYRDYLDTRDLVEAYALVMGRGRPGEVYNVCSEEAIQVEDLFKILVDNARTRIEYRIAEYDQSGNIPYQVGDAQKIRAETGWRKRRDVRETVLEILDYWRAHPAGS